MTAQISNFANAAETTLTGTLAVGSATVNVSDTSAFPAAPFSPTINPGNDALREVVRVTAKTATTLTVVRSASVQHESGAVVALVPVAEWFTDLHDRVSAKEDSGAAASEVATHVGDADPHPGYLTTAEGNAAYEALVSRTGATAGEVATLQADNTLAFAAAAGGGDLTVISETVLASATATITFSSIPSTYRDLRLVIRGRTDRANSGDQVRVRLNSDSTAAYDEISAEASGSAMAVVTTAGNTSALVGQMAGGTAPAGSAGLVDVLLGAYAGTTFRKHMIGLASFHRAAGDIRESTHSAIWLNTSAVNSITVLCLANFAAGTTATLYGVNGA